jgi:hypothetical protein
VVASGVLPALLAAFAAHPVGGVGRSGAAWLTSGGAPWTLPAALIALVALARGVVVRCAPRSPRPEAAVAAGAEPVGRRGAFARGFVQLARDLGRPERPTTDEGVTPPPPRMGDLAFPLCAPQGPNSGARQRRNSLAFFTFRDVAGSDALPLAELATRVLADPTGAPPGACGSAATFPPPDPRPLLCKTNPPLGRSTFA